MSTSASHLNPVSQWRGRHHAPWTNGDQLVHVSPITFSYYYFCLIPIFIYFYYSLSITITLPEQTRHLNFRLSPRRFCVKRCGGAGTRLATYRVLAPWQPWEGLAPRHRRVLNLC